VQSLQILQSFYIIITYNKKNCLIEKGLTEIELSQKDIAKLKNGGNDVKSNYYYS